MGDRKAFIVYPSSVASSPPAILVIFRPNLTPFISQALSVITMARHAMVKVEVAPNVDLGRGFRHNGNGKWIWGRRWSRKISHRPRDGRISYGQAEKNDQCTRQK
jgi:hypothetical protein